MKCGGRRPRLLTSAWQPRRLPPQQNLRWRDPLSLLDHVVDRRGKIIDARAGHDDRVTAAVRFLRDAEKFAAVIFAELHVEMLTFDLQLPSLYEVIHCYEKNGGV